VPAHALAIQRALELSPDEGDHERTHRRRDFLEKFLRAFGEISGVEPTDIDECPAPEFV